MRSIRDANPVEGVDTLTPHQINAELAELVGVVMSIDRDNVTGAALNPIRVANDTFGSIVFSPLEGPGITTVFTSQESNGQLFPIPDDSGNPWTITHATQDGALEIELGQSHEITTSTTNSANVTMWIGILVDGVLVGKSPWCYGRGATVEPETIASHRQSTVNVATPVNAGTHKLEPVFGIHFLGVLATDANLTIAWNGRSCWSREVRR